MLTLKTPKLKKKKLVTKVSTFKPGLRKYDGERNKGKHSDLAEKFVCVAQLVEIRHVEPNSGTRETLNWYNWMIVYLNR